MTVEITDLAFLRQEGLTTKDKLVLLAAHVADTVEPKPIADALGLSVASTKQSLAKAGLIDTKAELNDIEEVARALMSVCNMQTESMRDKDWKHLRAVAADLVAAGASPTEVRRRAATLTYRLKMPVTLGSLDKYWAQLSQLNPWAPGEVLR